MKEGKITKTRYLTLIDFTLSSKQKRLWVIDLDSLKIIHNSLVAHGKNTGEEYAIKFSNTPRSDMSSLGFREYKRSHILCSVPDKQEDSRSFVLSSHQ